MIDRLIANHYLKQAIDQLGNGMCTLAMLVSSHETLSEEDENRMLELWIDTCRNVVISVNHGAELLERMRTLSASTVSMRLI